MYVARLVQHTVNLLMSPIAGTHPNALSVARNNLCISVTRNTWAPLGWVAWSRQTFLFVFAHSSWQHVWGVAKIEAFECRAGKMNTE